MTPQQIAALELAVDQARDAGAAYVSALLSVAVQAKAGESPALMRSIAITQTNAESSVLWLADAEQQSQKLRCGRSPCDRNGGICPRCFPEVL